MGSYNLDEDAVGMSASSAKLAFVYLIRTSYIDVYKLGLTQTSVSGRHKKPMDRMGGAHIQAVVMTLDA